MTAIECTSGWDWWHHRDELEEMTIDERDEYLFAFEAEEVRRAQDEYAAELTAEYERLP